MERLLRHPRLLAGLQYGGYSLFFVIALVLCLPWTFPSRQLRNFVARQARQQGYPVHMDDIRLRGLGSVRIDGLRLTLPGKPGEPGEGGAIGPALPEVELKIDVVRAKVSILPLLFGRNIDVQFDLEAGDGKLVDGRLVKKGDVIDFEIGQIDALALADLGIGRRALGPQTMLLGDLDAKIGGKAQVHYGGSTEDLTGAVELELADAVLKSPELSMMGGFKLTDLGVGTLTLKVKMGLKQNIAALAAQRGAEKATVLHIETLQAEGDELQLVTEETSHILIPPGKGGFKQATIQLHFAFQFQDSPKKKAADAKAAADKTGDKAEAAADAPVDDRAKWTKVLSMAGSRLKPFERNGFIGIGCTGPLLRPQCKPELPMVTTGTKAAGGARPEGQPGPAMPAKDSPGAGSDQPTPGAEPAAAAPPNVEFKPAVRADAPPVPEPAAAAQPPPSADPPPAEARPAEGQPPPPPPEGAGRGERPPAPPEGRGREAAGEDPQDQPRETGRGESGGGEGAGDRGEGEREPRSDEAPKGDRPKRAPDDGSEE